MGTQDYQKENTVREHMICIVYNKFIATSVKLLRQSASGRAHHKEYLSIHLKSIGFLLDFLHRHLL